MLSDKQLTEFAYLISARFEAVNSHFLKKMGEQIKSIGKLNASNLRRLEQMMITQQNIVEINKQLSQATKLSLDELYKVYEASGMSVYGDTEKYYKANGRTQIPFKDNMWMQDYIASVQKRTAGTFMNMANTTVVNSDYVNLVDTAISAVTSGVTDYNSAIRSQLTDMAMQGIKVQYASGVTRRLDSAIRMNVLEGIRQINNGVREQAGKEFGADGVEISVHGLCAKDHIDIQGKQFATGPMPKEVDGVVYPSFDQVDGALKRKITTCNCRHIKFPILLGVSEPANSQAELDYYKKYSEEPVTITTGYTKQVDKDGNEQLIPKTKTITRYQASQVQRNIETEVRKMKDLEIISNASGDTVLNDLAKQRIKELQAKYKRISNEAELKPRFDKMYVPGYNGKQVVPKSIKIDIRDNVTETVKTMEISHTTVQGKDIINTWERRPDKFDFEIEDVINAQGFDGLPRVVNAEEFDKYVKESNFIAQRTYSAPTQEILEQYQKELYEGKWYVDCSTGGAVHGKGMYAAGYEGTSINEWLKNTMVGYGSNSGYSFTETMTFTKDFKFTTPEELNKIKMSMNDEYVKKSMQLSMDASSGKISMDEAMEQNSKLMESIMNNTKDDGQLASLLGYDGIRVDRGEGEYYVVLNRTKCIFLKE